VNNTDAEEYNPGCKPTLVKKKRKEKKAKYTFSQTNSVYFSVFMIIHCKKFGVGFTWKNLAKLSHSENASKFIKICQVKT